MNEQQRIQDWVRHYNVALLKFGALRAVYRNDGEKMLNDVLKALKLQTAADVVRACKSSHE